MVVTCKDDYNYTWIKQDVKLSIWLDYNHVKQAALICNQKDRKKHSNVNTGHLRMESELSFYTSLCFQIFYNESLWFISRNFANELVIEHKNTKKTSIFSYQSGLHSICLGHIDYTLHLFIVNMNKEDKWRKHSIFFLQVLAGRSDYFFMQSCKKRP